MIEQAEVQPRDSADFISDREAGQLLLAFLTAVILVLAAATVPIGPTLPESADGTVVTENTGAGELHRAELRRNS
jgi:hypothetical protein